MQGPARRQYAGIKRYAMGISGLRQGIRRAVCDNARSPVRNRTLGRPLVNACAFLAPGVAVTGARTAVTINPRLLARHLRIGLTYCCSLAEK
jgi:hypothetical protein